MRVRTKYAIGVLCGLLLILGAVTAFRIYIDHALRAHQQIRIVENLPFQECSTISLPAVKTPSGEPLTLAGLAGNYRWNCLLFAGGDLDIQPDGTWKERWGGVSSPTEVSTGVMRIVDGRVEFEVFSHDGKPTGRHCASIPVWWMNRLYLVDRAGAASLCDEINWGIRPPHEITHLLHVDLTKDRSPAAGSPGERFPSLPPEFSGWILDRPMKGKIVNVLPDGTATVDFGSGQGAFVGMRLAAEQVAGSREWGKGGNIEVISAVLDSCVVKRTNGEDLLLQAGMSVSCPASGHLLR